MRIVLATGNRGKVAEFQEGLSGLGWQVEPLPEGIELPEETGATYEENATIKAAYVAHNLGQAALADDSGLEVEALDWEPGVYSARFGNRNSDLERNLLLLEKLRQVRPPRRARFVSVLALAWPDGSLETFRGEVEGVILEGPRGDGGFGYDPLFLVPELGKTFAELSVEEKRAVSHRGRALQALSEFYSK